MTRTFVLRLIGLVGVALSLMLAVAGGASAQIALDSQSVDGSAPTTSDSQIRGETPDAQIQGEVSAQSCGFFVDRSDHHYSKYTHCGGAWNIKIRVNDRYGWNSRDIWVSRGTTNLSTDWRLDDFWMITNAWCIENCW